MSDKVSCPKCGRLMYERDIDWVAGNCYICDDQDTGVCAKCGKTLAISRGENFELVDDKFWYCQECFKKIEKK